MIEIKGFLPQTNRLLRHVALLKTDSVTCTLDGPPEFTHKGVELEEPLAALLYMEDLFTGVRLFGSSHATKARCTQLLITLFRKDTVLMPKIKPIVQARRGIFLMGETSPSVLDLAFEPYAADSDYTRAVERFIELHRWR